MVLNRNLRALCSLLFGILISLIGTTQANIVDMGSFNLPTMTLINKYDFSYGDADGDEELDEAAIRFDLKFAPQNTAPN